tara:strand:- start:1020 stop:1220 length:201 start_codon:yes stop_codon:yes gene_type:complete
VEKKILPRKISPHKVYHIYAKDECLYKNLTEGQFKKTWITLNGMVGIMKTDYVIEDLSYEEITVSG